MVERAQIVLACMGEHRVDQVARELGVNVSTVYKWRDRFRQYGMGMALRTVIEVAGRYSTVRKRATKSLQNLRKLLLMDWQDGMARLWQKR